MAKRGELLGIRLSCEAWKLIRWIERIDAGQAPIIFGDGRHTMHFVHVQDVALATNAPRDRRRTVRGVVLQHLWCVTARAAAHETFAFSSPVATSSSSSIRLHPQPKNPATRVLPNPDNSSAYDALVRPSCFTRRRSGIDKDHGSLTSWPQLRDCEWRARLEPSSTART